MEGHRGFSLSMSNMRKKVNRNPAEIPRLKGFYEVKTILRLFLNMVGRASGGVTSYDVPSSKGYSS